MKFLPGAEFKIKTQKISKKEKKEILKNPNYPDFKDYGFNENAIKKYNKAMRYKRVSEYDFGMLYFIILIFLITMHVVTMLLTKLSLELYNETTSHVEIINFTYIISYIIGTFILTATTKASYSKLYQKTLNSYTPKEQALLQQYQNNIRSFVLEETNKIIQKRNKNLANEIKNKLAMKVQNKNIENYDLLLKYKQDLSTENIRNLLIKYLPNLSNSKNIFFDFMIGDEYVKCIGYDNKISKIELSNIMQVINKKINKVVIYYSNKEDINKEFLDLENIKLIDINVLIENKLKELKKLI